MPGSEVGAAIRGKSPFLLEPASQFPEDEREVYLKSWLMCSHRARCGNITP
jgi:hypothetical protein